MGTRFPSIFSFSKLAMIAVAAMVVFADTNKAKAAKSTASAIVEAGTTPTDAPMMVDGGVLAQGETKSLLPPRENVDVARCTIDGADAPSNRKRAIAGNANT